MILSNSNFQNFRCLRIWFHHHHHRFEFFWKIKSNQQINYFLKNSLKLNSFHKIESISISNWIFSLKKTIYPHLIVIEPSHVVLVVDLRRFEYIHSIIRQVSQGEIRQQCGQEEVFEVFGWNLFDRFVGGEYTEQRHTSCHIFQPSDCIIHLFLLNIKTN